MVGHFFLLIESASKIENLSEQERRRGSDRSQRFQVAGSGGFHMHRNSTQFANCFIDFELIASRVKAYLVWP